jgi:succinate dehydrogenase hydrophobic anchor subunit
LLLSLGKSITSGVSAHLTPRHMALPAVLVLVTLHSVRFATASLTIHKYRRVEALHDPFNEAPYLASLINIFLHGALTQYLIEAVVFVPLAFFVENPH